MKKLMTVDEAKDRSGTVLSGYAAKNKTWSKKKIFCLLHNLKVDEYKEDLWGLL